MESIVNLLNQSVNKAKQITTELKLIKNLFKNNCELDGFSKLNSLLKENIGNIEIIKEVLLLLQFVNNEDVYKTYSLDHIESIYSEIVNLYPLDIDIQIEYAYYLSLICNDENKGFRIINNLEKSFSREIEEFDAFHNNERYK